MKISIITITYNSEKTLEETIRSVQSQHYPELEYLIVDGDSKDHTMDIVKRYPDVVTTWISEPDNGISDAFNKGIRMATGELIGIINSDDLLANGTLEYLAQNISPDTDVIFGDAILFGGNEKPYRYHPFELSYFARDMAIIHPATFVRKQAYEKYGLFSTDYKCQMDRELLYRMYEADAKFQYVQRDLAHMRLDGTNQRNYIQITIPEGIRISVAHGTPERDAKRWARSRILRFKAATFVRKFPFAGAIRKFIHSKQTELNTNKEKGTSTKTP